MTEWKDGIAKLILPTPFPVGDVNVYVIKGELLTLVDVGPKTEEAWQALNEQLKELDLQPGDVEQVVLTHHHPDHAGLLDYFSASLPVYGHPLNNRWLQPTESFLAESEQFFIKSFHEFGIPKDYWRLAGAIKKELKYSCNRLLTGFLTEGDSPQGLSDWKVIETPGHAQSHIGLYREKDGCFIGGDHLLAHVSPNPILEPPISMGSDRPKPLLQYNASIKKLLDIPINLVYSGHGEDILHKNELILNRLSQQHERAKKVKKMLEKNALTVFEACQLLFPKVYERQLSLTMSETVGQFDYLMAEKEIKECNEDGVFRYTVS
ncbi:MBL fold metallo-hydrolase [Robertmurraya sp. DFI.2.37]|uniref:MBL fold metallo-hydrolase n=1 Tax=Robertmurraya sp. DFI.2.37 TaxID=3031819 RepID=UPI001246BFF2|nr:MBL fold metallo-hydrolase [Robertmurraya sp. DFI.2.37]MDF1507527.1 MBL fold metallo-hydrolase [Robertmurraya sp. DFI.2.37]